MRAETCSVGRKRFCRENHKQVVGVALQCRNQTLSPHDTGVFQRCIVGGVGQHAEHAVANRPFHAVLALVHDQKRNTGALQLMGRAPAYASEAADDDMVLQLVNHFPGPPFPKILREFQLDDHLRHAAHRQQQHGYAEEYQKRIENPPVEAEWMQLLVTNRGHRDQRHVERVERGIMLDPYESQRSAADNQQNSAAQNDQPSAEAAHAVATSPFPRQQHGHVVGQFGYARPLAHALHDTLDDLGFVPVRVLRH